MKTVISTSLVTYIFTCYGMGRGSVKVRPKGKRDGPQKMGVIKIHSTVNGGGRSTLQIKGDMCFYVNLGFFLKQKITRS